MYSYEDRIRAVELYIQLGKRPVAIVMKYRMPRRGWSRTSEYADVRGSPAPQATAWASFGKPRGLHASRGDPRAVG